MYDTSAETMDTSNVIDTESNRENFFTGLDNSSKENFFDGLDNSGENFFDGL